MNTPALITAACIAIGAASIAASAQADPVCDAGAEIFAGTLDMRFSGLSRATAQAIASDAVIAGTVGMDGAEKVAFIAAFGPVIARLVDDAYGLPLDHAGDPAEQIADYTNIFLRACEGETF